MTSPFIINPNGDITREATVRPPSQPSIARKFNYLRHGFAKSTLPSNLSTYRSRRSKSKRNRFTNISAWRKTLSEAELIETLHKKTHFVHLTMLATAVRSGKVGEFLTIVNHCTDNCRGFKFERLASGQLHNGTPYIIQAIQRKRFNMVKQMLNMGVSLDVYGPAPQDFPAIIYGALTGYIKLIELLMKHGAVLTEHDIHLVKKRNRFNQTGKKLPNEEQLLEWLNKYWSQKLLKATIIDNTDAVLMILAMHERHKIGNGRDTKRNAPIHIAAANGNKKIVELLLKHNEDLKHQTNGSYMKKKALQIAFENDQLKVAKFLMQKGSYLTLGEFKNTLSVHANFDETTKEEFINTWAQLIVQATGIEDKITLLPPLTAHLKMLNVDGGMIVRQLAQILTMATFQRKRQAEKSEFEGPYAISDELLAQCFRKSDTLRRKEARERENSFRIANERPMSAKESLASIQLSRSTSRPLLLSPRTKELMQSKDMIQLTKSNVIPSETPEQRLQRISHVISTSRIRFSEHMDDIITSRLEQQKQQRRSMLARKSGLKWKHRSRQATVPAFQLHFKPKFSAQKSMI